MAISIVAVAIGVFLIARARWISEEGDRSKLSDAFFLRMVWNASTNVWVVRWLGLCFIALGVWGVTSG